MYNICSVISFTIINFYLQLMNNKASEEFRIANDACRNLLSPMVYLSHKPLQEQDF
jgi:hypothetical protein